MKSLSMHELIQRSKIVKRITKGLCIFCLKSNVIFNKEHLPPENISGKNAIELVDWVCSSCNSKFKKEDEYFGKNYHGSVFRVLQTIIGKKGRGVAVERKDIEAKYHPDSKTIKICLKRNPKPGEIEAANPESSPANIGHIVIEEGRAVNPRRLGKCLAKMALETVACLNPDPVAVLQPTLHPIRQYAQGQQGQIEFLPYAYGASSWKPCVQLTDVKFAGELSEVMVALLLDCCVFESTK